MAIPIKDANNATRNVATDLVGTDEHQAVKIEYGAAGAATPVSATNPLPVAQTGALPAGSNVIGGVTAADGALASVGATGDADTANTVIGRLKKLVALHGGGLPAALSAGGNLKVVIAEAGTATPVTGSGTFNVNPTGETAGVGVGAATDAEASGNGSVIAILKRLRTLLAGGLPGALTAGGGLKVGVVDALPAGNNNIGDVDVLTQPARSRTTDSIAAAIQTDALMSGTTTLTPKFAVVSASAAGDNTVVAAVASKKIRVISYVLVAAGAVTAKWRSGTTDISGPLAFAANGGAAPGYNPFGFFETASGAALNLNLSAAVTVGGHITYVEV